MDNYVFNTIQDFCGFKILLLHFIYTMGHHVNTSFFTCHQQHTSIDRDQLTLKFCAINMWWFVGLTRFHSWELDSGTKSFAEFLWWRSWQRTLPVWVSVKADVIKRPYHKSNQTALTRYLNNESRRRTRCHLKVFFRSSVNTRESTKRRILNCITFYNSSLASYRTFLLFLLHCNSLWMKLLLDDDDEV